MNLELKDCRCENVSTGERWESERTHIRDRAVRCVVLPPLFDPVKALSEVQAHERRNKEVGPPFRLIPCSSAPSRAVTTVFVVPQEKPARKA